MRFNVFIIMLLATLNACSDPDADPIPPKFGLDFQIAPDPVPILWIGQTVQLVALTRDGDGAAIWNSSNSRVAGVSSGGMVSALDTGRAWIAAMPLADVRVRDSVLITVWPKRDYPKGVRSIDVTTSRAQHDNTC